MNNLDLLDIYDHEVRQRAQWTRMTQEVFPNIVRHTSHERIRGAVISWFDLDGSDADIEIAAQAAHYKNL